ncbi:hypothetical protein [uncultured Mailhella sp.]|uniref:hypothetical protein n=1 Tax=uncultured Mailhella sp. TaxID=1981031 RepID=UPI003208BD48
MPPLLQRIENLKKSVFGTGTKILGTIIPYGNTANTVCEGDDSRLSDARTPKAYTHSPTDLTSAVPVSKGGTGATTAEAARENLEITPENIGALPTEGKATSATKADSTVKLETARTISLTGDVTGSTSFDGSANKSISATLANSGVTAGSYGPTANATPAAGATFNVPQVTVDAKGRVTGVVNRTVKIPAAPTSVSGNAGSATKLATARTISLTGDVTGSTSFDGSADKSIAVTLADSGVTEGSYGPTASATIAFGGSVNVPQVTVDTKGRVTTVASRAIKMPAAPTSVSGNAGSATKLQTARTLDGVSFNGSAAITHYGTCSTAAATAAKTVFLTGFTLVTGAVIFVRFTVTNTAANPTLNVNGTGAKAIQYRNAAISAGYLAANRTYVFVYDGSSYELVGDINTDTKLSIATQAEAEAGTDNAKAMTPLRVKQAMVKASYLPTSGGTITGNLTVTGTITGNTVHNAVWNDYAEYFPRAIHDDGTYERTAPGDIIALDLEATVKHGRDMYRKAREGDIAIAGIHSDTFGHIVGGEYAPDGSDSFTWNLRTYIPVGLTGRVRCRMENPESLGSESLGKRVVPSCKPGLGRIFQTGDKVEAVVGFITALSDNEHDGMALLKLSLA